jgi:hypothetical protein
MWETCSLSIITVQDMRFSQQCWRCGSSGIWHCCWASGFPCFKGTVVLRNVSNCLPNSRASCPTRLQPVTVTFKFASSVQICIWYSNLQFSNVSLCIIFSCRSTLIWKLVLLIKYSISVSPSCPDLEYTSFLSDHVKVSMICVTWIEELSCLCVQCGVILFANYYADFICCLPQ